MGEYMQNGMTEEEFARIYRFIKSRYGISLDRRKEIVQGRLDNYLQWNGYANYTEYMNEVEACTGGRLERELINILTTNHTFFMREFEHFDFLRQQVLPQLRRKEERKKDLCIWCGAASTGQEPYMLAMLLKEFFGWEAESWDTKVLATDVNTQVLSQAIKGIYDKDHIQELPESWKRRFLQPLADGEQYEIVQEIKNEVIFRQFNLMDDFPFKRKMHIVFLRNVMIYFDKDTRQQLVQKTYDAMEPGGYLFVGRTETLDKSQCPFEMIQPSVFRKPEGK